jgi:hypothetical protein
MLSVEDWAEIRRLYRAEGLPEKVIARVLGISVNTVKAALARDGSLRSSCRWGQVRPAGRRRCRC